VENPLSSRLLRGEFKEGDTIRVDRGGDSLTFRAKKIKIAEKKNR
jgi:ATP-dependent Clp protease ATP-binding subunit ClpC